METPLHTHTHKIGQNGNPSVIKNNNELIHLSTCQNRVLVCYIYREQKGSQIWCPIYISYYYYICFEGWWKVLLVGYSIQAKTLISHLKYDVLI